MNIKYRSCARRYKCFFGYVSLLRLTSSVPVIGIQRCSMRKDATDRDRSLITIAFTLTHIQFWVHKDSRMYNFITKQIIERSGFFELAFYSFNAANFYNQNIFVGLFESPSRSLLSIRWQSVVMIISGVYFLIHWSSEFCRCSM